MEKNRLEDITSKETAKQKIKKPGFIRRNLKKIALGTGALFLSAAIGIGYFGLKKEGKTITGQLDGKIDITHYHTLALENKVITDISQIEDLVAEVYHLNTGRKIEDDYRFTYIDENNKPLRVILSSKIAGIDFNGLNWGNGDIYIPSTNFLDSLRWVFHEKGHGKAESTFDLLKRLDNYKFNT